MNRKEYLPILRQRNRERNVARQKYFISDNQWKETIANSKSKREVLVKLGIKNAEKGNYQNLITEAIVRLNLDISHFPRDSHKRTLEEILVENSPFTHTGHLKEKLLKAGLKQSQCDECGLREWRADPVFFDLHHINGTYDDNRLENLQILCPNCHAQTPNYGHKNRGNGRRRMKVLF